MTEPYYLTNFRLVLEDVQRRMADLLRPEEADLLTGFLALPSPEARLYVRMLTRKGPWFRRDRLVYPEIPDPDAALAGLAAAGWCLRQGPAEALLPLLRRAEAEALLADGGRRPARSARLDDLLAQLAEEPDLTAILNARLEPVRPVHVEWAELLFALFFGNLEQDLSALVLADLGQVRYEAYPLNDTDRIFQTREELDFLRSLRDLEAGLAEPGGLAGVTQALLAMERHPGVRQQRRYQRLLNTVAREWERQADPATALACYAASDRPPARERTVRIRAAQGEAGPACALAIRLAESPLDVSEAEFARGFLTRQARREPLASAWLAANPAPPPLAEVRLLAPPHPDGVEAAALQVAAAQGWDGWHGENTLWRALFGLAFWDILFAPVPGAFQHRFQAAPADLGSPDFAAARREAIQARLAEAGRPGALARRIRATAEAKHGLACTLVAWKALPADLLEAALDTLPDPVLGAFLAAMASSPRALGSGFPDLFLARPDRSACALWEVKGPGDTLRPEQVRWLRFFAGQGLDARVARVALLRPGA